MLIESSLEPLRVTTSEPRHLRRGLARRFREHTMKNWKVQAQFHRNRSERPNYQVPFPTQTTERPNGTMRGWLLQNQDRFRVVDRRFDIAAVTQLLFSELP